MSIPFWRRIRGAKGWSSPSASARCSSLSPQATVSVKSGTDLRSALKPYARIFKKCASRCRRRRALRLWRKLSAWGCSSNAMDLQRHLWKVVLGLAVLTGAAYELWPPRGYEGVVSAGLNALALAAVLVGIHLHRPVRRLPWYLVAFCA